MQAQQIYISPPDLHTVLLNHPSSVLLIDIRQKEDYDAERIASSLHLDIIEFLDHNKRYSSVSPPECENLFIHQVLYDIVVITEEGKETKRAGQLMQFFMQFERERKVNFLFGGYKTYAMLYPTFCVGSPLSDQYKINQLQKNLMGNSPVEVLPFVYCGGVEHAKNVRALDMLGIDYIINATTEFPNINEDEFKWGRCAIEEFPSDNLTASFDKVYSIIEHARSRRSKVLVQGEHGKNRAGVVVCAYLMKKNDWCVEKAYEYVKDKHHPFAPNIVCLARLIEYEKALNINMKVKCKYVIEELLYLRRKEEAQDDEEDDSILNEEQLEEDLC